MFCSWEESKDLRSFVNVFLKGSCLELHDDVMRMQTAHPQKVYCCYTLKITWVLSWILTLAEVIPTSTNIVQDST